MPRLITILIALSICTCHHSERKWLPSERWLASPAMSYGGWKCADSLTSKDYEKVWDARLSDDNYYWCYAKDAPK